MGLATITAADVDSASSDNCNLTLSIDSTSWDCSGLGAHTVMLVGTDGALSDTAYATVTVIDTIAPELICAGDTTLIYRCRYERNGLQLDSNLCYG